MTGAQSAAPPCGLQWPGHFGRRCRWRRQRTTTTTWRLPGRAWPAAASAWPPQWPRTKAAWWYVLSLESNVNALFSTGNRDKGKNKRFLHRRSRLVFVSLQFLYVEAHKSFWHFNTLHSGGWYFFHSCFPNFLPNRAFFSLFSFSVLLFTIHSFLYSFNSFLKSCVFSVFELKL